MSAGRAGTRRRARWVANRILLGVTGFALSYVPMYVGYGIIAGILLLVVYEISQVPRQQPCVICDRRDTLPMPVPPLQERRWWQLTPRDTYSWVCEDHVMDWIRLQVAIEPVTDER